MNYVVTGANRGIGFGLTRALVARGDSVIGTARDPGNATELRELEADYPDLLRVVALDVADPDSFAPFADALGPTSVDVLINNAGRFTHVGEPGEFDYDGFFRDFAVNTVGPLRVVEALLDNLRANGGGIICNVTSNLGSLEQNTTGDFYAYRASKSALNTVTRSLAVDLAADNIVAFLMHPGWVRTDMGGPNGEISLEESVGGFLAVLDSIGPEDSGTYRAWDGTTLPW